MPKVFMMAGWQTGDASEDKVEIPDFDQCTECEGLILPLVGAIVAGHLRWDVWHRGSFEHLDEPDVAHIPAPRYYKGDM